MFILYINLGTISQYYLNSNLRFKFKREKEENEIKKKRLHLALWTNFFSPAHSPYSRSPVLHPCARLRQTLAAMWAHVTSHTPAARTNLGTMHLGSPLRLTVGPSAKLHVPTLCVASLPVGPPLSEPSSPTGLWRTCGRECRHQAHEPSGFLANGLLNRV